MKKLFFAKWKLIYAAFTKSSPKLSATAPPWVKWGVLTACVGLAAVCISGAMHCNIFSPTDKALSLVPTSETTEDIGFTLSDLEQVVYYPITFDARCTYGLVATDAVGLTEENAYTITENDLGAFMGTVAACDDETLIGCKVYHFANYPELDSICILDAPSGYAFYTAEWLNLEVPVGERSDLLLEAYNLPESLQTMEVLSNDLTHLFTVEEDTSCYAILSLLEGRENSGLEANNRRFAQAWYDAFGNEDVYYSEEDGCVHFQQPPSNPNDNTIIYTDTESNMMVQNTSPSDNTLEEQAEQLWSAGERIIRITTQQGFQVTINYFPSINTFILNDGYFELSSDDAATLNTLLQIESSSFA